MDFEDAVNFLNALLVFDDFTPLMNAARVGSEETIRILLEAEADTFHEINDHYYHRAGIERMILEIQKKLHD